MNIVDSNNLPFRLIKTDKRELFLLNLDEEWIDVFIINKLGKIDVYRSYSYEPPSNEFINKYGYEV